MSPDEAARLEPGQFVHVRLKLCAVPSDGKLVSVAIRTPHGSHTQAAVCAKNIVAAERLPLRVGDQVTWGNGHEAYELVAIRASTHGLDWGVLWHPHLCGRSYLLSGLRRVKP